jgi:hypothetical protein
MTLEFCPTDASSGFTTLTGSISESILTQISAKKNPIYVAFAPRTTPSSISGNRIVESGENTCLYRNKLYTLIDIQVCEPLHTGYQVPGMADIPVAEMILTFSGSEISGILLCVPIYNTGATDSDQYLNQIIEQITDPKRIVTLGNIFINNTKKSFGYRTCFEIKETNNVYHRQLYVLFFPSGIHMSSANFTKLKLSVGNSFIGYQVPPVIRSGNITLKTIDYSKTPHTFTINDSEHAGRIYVKSISIASEQFAKQFEYFTMPPATVQNKDSKISNTIHYATSQYKCVPLNKDTDITSNNIVIPGNGVSLNTVLDASGNAVVASKSAATDGIDIDPVLLEKSIGIALASFVGAVILGSIIYHIYNSE